ncbi:hypothetical protein CkaCkLH20_11292 [Colletotrichum karsti]|uniref:Uncharacterized protein n=1 Tax=Colletotrichum karsti TaxID=1095194 RepID=A0A9P6LF49_9PEZI|nr:uncharacterized protein CkaCkLH20_11292 [Colletotrichum karsti]KAF9871123.1 hypothetical protein CkaCkLH20_11292 [Colletotrichum karsti]
MEKLQQHPELLKRGGRQPQTRSLREPPPKRKIVVHQAPTHDGSQAYVAYAVPETVADDDEASLTAHRPPYAFVFYDTTPEALRPGRSRELACEIFERTYRERRATTASPDRIEVIAMPMPQPFSSDIWDSEKQWKHLRDPKPIEPRGHDDRFDYVFPWLVDRVRACVLHYEAELKSRRSIEDRKVAESWYLPERIGDEAYARGIFLISRLEEVVDDTCSEYGSPQNWLAALGWTIRVSHEDWYPISDERADNSVYGSVLQVLLQPREERWENVAGVTLGEEPWSHIAWKKVAFELIGKLLEAPEHGVEKFYNHYVTDGILKLELESFRKEANRDPEDRVGF